MTRVLIGDFGAIVRLGFEEFLQEEGGVQIVAENVSKTGMIEGLIAAHPDVVVLDMDDVLGLPLARQIAIEYPAVKVIACSSIEPRMRVFPRFHKGESYDETLAPETFAQAVKEG